MGATGCPPELEHVYERHTSRGGGRSSKQTLRSVTVTDNSGTLCYRRRSSHVRPRSSPRQPDTNLSLCSLRLPSNSNSNSNSSSSNSSNSSRDSEKRGPAPSVYPRCLPLAPPLVKKPPPPPPVPSFGTASTPSSAAPSPSTTYSFGSSFAAPSTTSSRFPTVSLPEQSFTSR